LKHAMGAVVCTRSVGSQPRSVVQNSIRLLSHLRETSAETTRPRSRHRAKSLGRCEPVARQSRSASGRPFGSYWDPMTRSRNRYQRLVQQHPWRVSRQARRRARPLWPGPTGEWCRATVRWSASLLLARLCSVEVAAAA
jgi:hypothetical protein